MNNISKRITALLMSGIIMASASVSAMAQTAPEVQTATVTQNLGATKTVEWNGKTTLKAGTKYTVSKNVTVSKKITIPSGTTVTVKKDAKLTVSSKGSLYVKGTLKVDSGATISVSGKLYEYKGKVISVSGTMSLGSKSDVTINGKLTVNSKGTIKGEPKKLTVGEKSVVTIKGKNDSKALAAALAPVSDTAEDDAAIKQLMTDMTSAIMVEFNAMKSLNTALPEGMVDEMKAAYDEMSTEEGGMTFEETMGLVVAIVAMGIQQELGAAPESVEITKMDIEYIDPTSVEITEEMAKYYNNIENAAKLNGAYVVKGGDNTLESEYAEDIIVVKMNGKWYMYQSMSEDSMSF